MSSVLGCGIDIEEPSRFHKYVSFSDGIPGLLKMIFTEEEISRNICIQPHLSFPLAFSCKEAVFKALGRSWTNSAVSWKDIELIYKDEYDLGNHEIRLGGHARELYEAMGCGRIESSFEINEDFIVFEVLFLSL